MPARWVVSGLPARLDDPRADLAQLILAMSPEELAGFTAGRDPGDLAVIEQIVAEHTAEGWRVDPSTMAAHLDAKYRRPRYIQLLGDVYRRASQEKGKRFIVSMPARLGKSKTLSQWGPTWNLDNYPDSRSILVSYGDELAMENALAVRDNLEAHRDVLRGQVRQDARRRDRFLTTEGGGILARGLYSAIRGFGVTERGVLTCDDLFKGWEQAHSPAARQKAWDTYRSNVRDRLDTEDAGIIHTAQRTHREDVIGQLIMEMDNGGEEWELIVIPALAVVDNDIIGRMIGDVIDPERFPLEAVQRRHRALGCTPAESPVLMADWTTKPISEVRPGEEVVGFEVEPGHKVRYVPTVVEAVHDAPGVVANFRMASGRTVRATRDHRWFKRAERGYSPARVGSSLRQVTEVDTEVSWRQAELWSWLAGMVDGEAHVRRSSIVIQQAVPRNAPVFDRLIEVLTELGVPHTIKERDRSKWKNWSDTREVFIQRSGWVMRMLLEHTPIAKGAQLAAALYEGSGRTERTKDKVLAIGGDREEQVFALQTGTGNYVVWGYASSNSYLVAAQEQQDPQKDEGTELLRSWFIIAEAGEQPPAPDVAISSWDFKLKNKEAGDFVVGQAWWRVGDGFWLMDSIRGQFDHATTANAVALLAVRNPEVKQHVIETAGSYDEVVPQLRKPQTGYEVTDEMATRLSMNQGERDAVQEMRRTGIQNIVGHAPRGDKATRARMFIAPKAEAGLVRLPAGRVWIPAFLDEIASFGTPSAHDDQVDCASMALQRLDRGQLTVTEPQPTARRAAGPGQQRSAGPQLPRGSRPVAGGVRQARVPGPPGGRR